jgi:ABC-2 type transport system permease protein
MRPDVEPTSDAVPARPRRGYRDGPAREHAPGFGPGLAAALWAEALKARRSPVPLVTALAFALAPLMGGVFMLIAREPAWAHRLGLIAAKAELTTAAADWPTYLGLLAQSTAVGGFLLFGMVVIWLFGREHSDRTATDLLALPTSRESIVLAKLILAWVWSATLTAEVLLLGLGIGGAIGLPDWSVLLVLDASRRIAATAGLTMFVATPLALAASIGRGYLAPVGTMMGLVFLAQILAVVGWGAYFPWSVPALYSGAGGPELPPPGALSYALVIAVGVGGATLTAVWWRFADQT